MKKHVPCFYRVIETRVKVWENEKSENEEHVFYFFFRKYRDAKKKINLFTSTIKM